MRLAPGLVSFIDIYASERFLLARRSAAFGLPGKYSKGPGSAHVAIQQWVSGFHQSSSYLPLSFPGPGPELSIRSIVRYLLSGIVCFCRHAGLVLYQLRCCAA